MWGIFSHRCANLSPWSHLLSVWYLLYGYLTLAPPHCLPKHPQEPAPALLQALSVTPFFLSPMGSLLPSKSCGRFLLALTLPLLLPSPRLAVPKYSYNLIPLLFLCSFLSLSVVCSVLYPTPACLIPALPVHLPMSHSQHVCLTIKFPAWLRPPVVTSHMLLLHRRLYLLSLWCH